VPSTDIMMSNTQEQVNAVGPAVKADGWYGHEDGLHTVAIQVVNFTGRIYLEASLALEPTESDWFPMKIRDADFMEFPLNPMQPTGSFDTGGDTGTQGVTFKVNTVWLRAKMDRTYLNQPNLEDDRDLLASFGVVDKITLAR